MSDTSAIPSQRGDKYQDYYALFVILENLIDPESIEKDLSVKIEGLDDIELSENGKICKLIQTKHITTGTHLTNSSTDFWKTIGIWSELISENKVTLSEVTFFLVTTADASKNHAPKLLSEGKIEETLIEMEKFVAQRIEEAVRKNNDENEKTTANEKAFLKFNKLDKDQKLNLLKSIKIYLNKPNLDEIKIKIKELLDIRTTIRKEHLNKFYDDMIDWWTGQIGTDYPSIHISEVRRKIRDLRDKYGKSILLNSYEGKDVNPPPEYDRYTFIKQMYAINGKYQIEEAKQDYHKVYLERSSWENEDDPYISLEDITNYLNTLIKDGWRVKRNAIYQRFLRKKKIDAESTDDEHILQEIGGDIYEETMKDHIPMRDGITAEYFMRGSYHELADREKIYWHPKFSEWLKKQG